MNQNTLPRALHESLTSRLGEEPQRVTPLSGGCINQAVRVELCSGAIFVKWNDQAAPQLFRCEARGLQLLQQSGTIRVPKVLCVQDEPQNGCPAFLALEYIEPHSPRDAKYFATVFGEQLAQLHQKATSKYFGLDHDNYLGEAKQLNAPRQSWPEFYRDCRLIPQIEWAQRQGYLSSTRKQLVMQVCERLEVLFGDLDSSPSLLHGDLWSGNYLAHRDEAVIFDPAVYFGEREMEIAYCELFGGFDAAFYESYQHHYPLQNGYKKRRPLHQLYHLLNHLNHFGESYGPRVEAACRTALQCA